MHWHKKLNFEKMVCKHFCNSTLHMVTIDYASVVDLGNNVQYIVVYRPLIIQRKLFPLEGFTYNFLKPLQFLFVPHGIYVEKNSTKGFKGISHDFIFQISLFSKLADIFAVLRPRLYILNLSNKLQSLQK